MSTAVIIYKSLTKDAREVRFGARVWVTVRVSLGLGVKLRSRVSPTLCTVQSNISIHSRGVIYGIE
jgi:hypothetical protein